MVDTSSDPNLLYAHTPAKGSTQWHLLHDHSFTVSDLAADFGSKFAAMAECRLVGLLHDAAKADNRFQAYLRACNLGATARSCPHAAPGAVAARPYLGPYVVPILGHHGGMPDSSDAQRMLANADPQSIASAKSWINSLEPLPNIVRNNQSNLTAEMKLRMIFSCLVDADFLDTERHFSPQTPGMRRSYPSISVYKRMVDNYLTTFSGVTGKVNRVRADVLDACRNAAFNSKGAFRLTVPTGGGKTLSGLAFALDHAVHHVMDRAIVAIPYTSIIEQTALVYAEAVGQENTLEHHSAVDTDTQENQQSEHELGRRLNCENWDCPLVVTTTVQLFESLLHNRPSHCRKLHNIVNSVIVLDEVQALPPKTLGPILDVLNELVANYGCSVVFCTATQLDYSTVDGRLLKDAIEIVPDYPAHFAALKRVEYVVEDKPRSLDSLTKSLCAERQVLAVFNTRKDALRVAKSCMDNSIGPLSPIRPTDIFHLSTLMCLHHRRQVLAEVRRRLRVNEPVRLISTQVVEAGVDVDFPVVYRDLGPLDRIIQVAGRCNREGRLAGKGRCAVIQLEDAGSPQGPYRTAIDITSPILAEYGSELDDPGAMAAYSRDLFRFTETGSLGSPNDRAVVQKLREDFNYATVASTFRLIEDDTTPVVIENYMVDNRSDLDVATLVAHWDTLPGGWFRRVAPFTVNLFTHDLTNLQRDGLIRQHDSGAWIYSGPYDQTFGLLPGLTDPTDLVS